MNRLLPLFIAMLLATGCASLSEKQCKTVNWQEQGARDAYDGWDRSRFEDHREACSEHGIATDTAAYTKGFDEGLARLCTAARGYAMGTEGKTYRNTCPPETDAKFREGFRLGSDIRKERRQIDSTQVQIRAAEEKLKKSQSAEEREKLRRQIRTLDEEILDAQRRVRRLEEDATRAGFGG